MIRRILLGLFVAAVLLPMVGCKNRHGSCRDTCTDSFYMPVSDPNR